GKFIFRDKELASDEEFYLIYGSCVVYFIAHSLFWGLGIFNSFGLLRVLVGIIPLIALIALRGFNAVTKNFQFKALGYILIALLIIFPFIHKVYGFNWKRDFSLKADQQAELDMAQYVKKNFPDYKNYVFFYEPPYVSVALDINYFDNSKHKRFI